MKLSVHEIQGELIKDDETYTLKDNKTLKNLVLSSTKLKPMKSTRGHFHNGQEEVYYFINGSGIMDLDAESFSVKAGDVVLIPSGAFHRVHNTEAGDLYFVCVFDGNRNH